MIRYGLRRVGVSSEIDVDARDDKEPAGLSASELLNF